MNAISQTLGMTQSVCNTCRRPVAAKIVTDGADVFFRKFCPDHGQTTDLVRRDLADYLRTLRYVKPAWRQAESAGDATAPCPAGCGFCSRHEQHLCMPIVEITTRCDLDCPACLVDAGGGVDMTLDEFRSLLDALIRAEKQIDVLNFSGGEPLVHPQLLDLVDEALGRPEVVRVSISTNGLALLREESLIGELHKRDVVVSLQFDGFDDRAYEILRGRPLLDAKRHILADLADADIATGLTVTLAGGVNDDQFPQILEYLFTQPNVVCMMIQPIAFAGRGAGLAATAGRLTIPDVIRLLGQAGDRRVSAGDFVPLPCAHPLCFTLAYYLMLDEGEAVSLNRIVDASEMMDVLSNRTIFGLDAADQDRIRDMIYDLWSGPAASAPHGPAVLKTLRGILDELGCCGFDARRAFGVTERRIKSIFIHAFQDAATFDLARVRRCCNAYPQADGRLIPACVHNVTGRTRPPCETKKRRENRDD